jgi:DNA-binding GntR family transcriptional regulator
MIESLWLQISPYFNLLHASGDYERANREHGTIAAALRHSDAKGARAAVAADIDGAAATLRQILSLAAERGASPTARPVSAR